jgi:hypothetical protein
MRSTAAPPSGQRPLPPVPPKEEEGIDSAKSVNENKVAKPKAWLNSLYAFFKTLWARVANFWAERGDYAQPASANQIVRPKVRFDSRWVFFITFVARFISAWTKKFALSLLTGQLVSLCLACATVTSNELVVRGWVLPITQTFFL